MFEELIQKLKKLAIVPPPFDPSCFGDPVASQTKWTPAKPGGEVNFRTRKLVKVGPGRIEFRPTLGGLVFYFLFLFVGLAIISGFFVLLSSPGFESRFYMLLLMGSIFAGVGGYRLYAGTHPVVFEKAGGIFWKGRQGRDEAFDNRTAGLFAHLDNVHALQLIAEYIGGKSAYYSYELNLVLRNGDRVNVVDQANLDKLREEAETVAAFLGKPLWDATKHS